MLSFIPPRAAARQLQLPGPPKPFPPLSALFLSVAAAAAAAALPGVRAEDLPVVTIKTPPGQMKYDRPVITAAPGSRLRLVFENLDEMPHNLVLCQPHPEKDDKGLEVAQLAWQLGAAGMGRAWVPDSPRVLAHTGLVAAHQKQELVLSVPDTPGRYPYVCTFPGHAMAMNGELRVVAKGPEFEALDYRLYLGEWTALPDFTALQPHRSGPVPDKTVSIDLEGMTEHFALQFEGTLEAPEDGMYEFHAASDDGSELFINGQSVLKQDGVHPASRVRTARMKLAKGPVKVRLDYFEYTGQEQLYLAWSGPRFSETPLSRWIHPARDPDKAADSARNPFSGIPLTPANGEAVIYRNFLEGSGPRGIAVGYPGGVNLCFDAGRVAPALFWQGAFIDAKRHWTDRGSGQQPPLGYNILKPAPEGPALAILPEDSTPWPSEKDGADLLRFRGYRLDARRFPSFNYELGSVSVTESYQPVPAPEGGAPAIVRTLQFSAPQPVSRLFLRAAAGSGLTAEADGWKAAGFRITVEDGHAELRNGTELLLPVTFAGSTASLSLTYHWVP